MSKVTLRGIGKPALWSATIAPLITSGGYVIAGASWPGYDPVVHAISDLAADDSPVQAYVSILFLVGALSDIIVSHYAKAFALPGRIAILLGAIATIGLTVFTTPSQTDSSAAHRIFASLSFLIFTIWPLLAMRRGQGVPPMLRPLPSIIGALVLGAISIWFLTLWLDPNAQIMGLSERIVVLVQAVYPAFVLWHSYLWLRKQK
jgi:hypothetical membrane protein